jgi:hypothetical protein
VEDSLAGALGARGRGQKAVCTDGVRAIVEAMVSRDVRRLVAVSAHGVAETHDRSPYSLAVWATVPLGFGDMMSMASDVGRSLLIALRSIGHAERTTALSIAAANVTASSGRLTAGNQLRSPSVLTGMFMNTFTGWGTASVANPIS